MSGVSPGLPFSRGDRLSRCGSLVFGLCLLAFAASLVGIALLPVAKQDRTPHPPADDPLPEEVALAWQEAGFLVGWLEEGDFGLRYFRKLDKGPDGQEPAFYLFRRDSRLHLPPQSFKARPRTGSIPRSSPTRPLWGAWWEAGGISNLPQPAHGFGLFLHHPQVTDSRLKELAAFKALKALSLHHTGVTDLGLKELAGLKSLKALDLYGLRITDEGLKELRGLTSLQYLNLTQTQVTDTGLTELAGMNDLMELNLFSTNITDGGVMHLAALKSLQRLDLVGTKVTDAGEAELLKVLPVVKDIRRNLDSRR